MRLIEVISCCAIMATGSVLILPSCASRRLEAEKTELIEKGRSIGQVFQESFNMFPYNPTHEELKLGVPSSVYRSSTEYFADLVEHQYFGTYAVFGGGGVPVYRGSQRSKFSAEYNAWAVVSDSNVPYHDIEYMPYAITRNNRADNVDEMSATNLADSTPLGRAGAVLVMRSCSVYYIDTTVDIDQIVTNRRAIHNRILSP